jgi:uncharacterized protein (UPF0335 family)
MVDVTPVKEALELLSRKMSKEEITRSLEGKGYTLQQIADGINQAQIKQGVEGNTMPPEDMQTSSMDENFDIPLPPQGSPAVMEEAPGPGQAAPQDYSQQQAMPPMQQAPQQYQMPAAPAQSVEEMQALVEQIVEEKWKEMMAQIGDIGVFKARVGDDMEAVKQELLRTQKRLESLQTAVLGKVKEYDQSVQGIGQDMKALEQVFSKIMAPLTSNVKELAKITEEMKKARSEK